MKNTSNAQQTKTIGVNIEAVKATVQITVCGKVTELTRGSGNVNVELFSMPRPLYFKR